MQFRDEELTAGLDALSVTELRAAASYIHWLLRERAAPGSDQAGAAKEPDLCTVFHLALESGGMRIVQASASAQALLGDHVLGRPFLDLVDADYRESTERTLAYARSHKQVKNIRLRLKCESGVSIPVSMAARLSQDSRVELICHDITHLKSLSNVEIFSEMLSIGIVLVDGAGAIVYANRFAEALFGFEQGDLEGKPLALIVPKGRADVHFVSSPGEPIPSREMMGKRRDGTSIELKIGWSSMQLGASRFAVASITDISAHKTIEGALRKYEEQRSLIFSEGLVGDFVWTVKSDQVEAHPTVFRLFGARPIAGPVPGDWFRSRQHPADQSETERKWREQLAAGEPLALEFRAVGDDGVTRWIDCRGIVVRDASGKPVQVHGLNVDITARKRAEAERLESEMRARSAEELFRIAMQFSGAIVWRWTAADNRCEWNGPVAQLTGRSAGQLGTFSQVKEMMVPEDVAGLQHAMECSMAAGLEFRHEFRIALPNGEVRWLAGRGGPLRDEKGCIYGLTGANFDITERKTTEEELRQSEHNFRQLTNLIPQIVFTSNAEGRIDYVNERFFEISGLAVDADINSSWPQMLFEEDRKAAVDAWAQSMAAGGFHEVECRVWNRLARQFRWNLVRAVPICASEEQPVRWIGTATDIHDRKTAVDLLEAEVASRTSDLKRSLSLLRQREEELSKSLLEKSALLREIHHRVKNNLQIVSSLLSMQAANAHNSVAAPLRDSERRISSMAMIHEQLYGTEDMQTVEFAEFTRSLAQSLLSSMAQTPALSFTLDLAPVTLTIHQAIPCALILNELLTNALKYAYPGEEGGEIVVRLSLADSTVAFTVSDSGVGLPDTVNPFAPHSLGLEIVHVLVQQIEGTLTVTGAPGVSFTVQFRPHELAADGEPRHSLKASATFN